MIRQLLVSQTVSHTVYRYWASRNVYPISKQAIHKRLQKHVNLFRKLARTHTSKRRDSWIQQYQNGKDSVNVLFDVFCEDETQRHKL